MSKEYTFKEKIFGLAELGRPIEWSKSLLNMFLASLIAYYIYNSIFDPLIFIIGFLSVAFLWSGLYALNDYTDWKIDLVHSTKKNRPIPSGKVSPKQGFIFSIVLIVASFLIAFELNNFLLVLCLGAMVLNQLLYTMDPFRLKSRKIFDIISGSMINPFFRYFSGIVLFVSLYRLQTYPFPIFPVLFVIGIQFSGYTLYRLFSKSHDKKIKMKSTVAILPEKIVKIMAYGVMGIAILSYLGLLINGITFKIAALGYLPGQYFIAILIVAVVILVQPSLRYAILNPQKADMKSSYRLLYGMNIAFVIANLLIFIFMR
ncbi:MAG: UbiA prenyltransferase family protein [archaeon]|jgi:4-hydroxybenzoate polyprenyltransferase